MAKINQSNIGLEFLLLRSFNRLFTVRRLEQFGNPVSAPIANLEFPRGSTFHFASGDVTEFGPSQLLPYIANTEKGGIINHHLEYCNDGIVGRPRKVPASFNAQIIHYHRINKRIRRLRDPKIVERDERILYIENYAPLVQAYKYTTTLMSWYERWYNTYRTIITQLASDAKTSNRQNYLIVNVPEAIPSINELRRAEKRRDNVTLKDMRNDNVLFLLELWTWLGVNRDNSLLSLIDQDTYRRVNIVVAYRDRFINLNLGELDFWRKSVDGKGRVKPEQMQRRLYKSYVDVATKAASYLADETNEEPGQQDPDSIMSPEEARDFVLGLNQKETDNDKVEDIDAEIKSFEDNAEIDDDAVIEIVQREAEDTSHTININEPVTLEAGILKACEPLIDAGLMQSKEYNFIKDKAATFKEIPNPYGIGKVADMLVVKPEELKVDHVDMIPNDPTLQIDPTLAKSTIVDYDKKYINTILPKDIVSSVASIQKAGVILNDYSVHTVVDASGRQDVHTIKVIPVGGEPSTLRFTMPKLDDRGYWVANDVTFNMRKQRVDVPIRKTGINTVALTSAYGKNFIERCTNVVANQPLWLTNRIIAIGEDVKNLSITDLNVTNCFDPTVRLPKDYTSIAQRITSFVAGNVVFNFDYRNRESVYGKLIDGLDDTLVPIGRSVDGLLVMDMSSTVYRKTKTGMDELGPITEVLNISTEKAPLEYTQLSMMGKPVPLCIVFAYYLGLDGLLKQFNIQHRVVEASERVAKGSCDYVIPCMNAKYLITFDDYQQSLIIGGFKRYLDIIKGMTQADMQNPDAYSILLQKDGLTPRYLNELTLMDEMFIDPITERMLVKMKEPVTFKGLLVRANEMLAYDDHREEIDLNEMHIYTAHRHAMAVYTEMVRSIRDYRNRPGQRKKMEMSSRAVWDAIAEDPSVLIAANANPIQSIREADVVTFGGTGGRSRRSMVKRTRKYTDSDIGIISGDTVDSGDVAITSYLTADPVFEDLDGYKDKNMKQADMSVNQMMSSAAALAPGCLYDDDKRINFVGIQHGSATFAKGYTVTGFRTGFEKVVAHRTSSQHANIAEFDGEVVAIDDAGITVRSNTHPPLVKSYQLGRTFGRHEGGVYPHQMVTKFKVGDTFKARDVLTYNDRYFTPDVFMPNQVNWKAGVMANVAFLEGIDTWEDSSAIDKWLADQLSTEVTKVKNITINFEQQIHGLLKVGAHVNTNSILCTIEDALTANSGAFNDESLATLSNLASQTPRSGVVGNIDKIEVFYNGDYEDMSESVLAIAKMGDRQRSREAKASPIEIATNGKVDSSLRIEGKPVELDTMVIRVYISHETGTIGGDKGVFANQLKTTFRRVMEGRNETENGDPVNALFGRVSVDNRIVLSVYQICTTNKISMLASEHCLKILNEEL